MAECGRTTSTLRRSATPLTVAILGVIVLWAVDIVFYYRVAVDMGDFVFIWGSVLYPILYCAACFPAVLVQYYRGRLTSATTSYPLKRLAFMAFLDQSYNLLSSWPIPVLGAAVSNVLSCCALPLNMVLAAWLLKGAQRPRYGWSHYLGALLCLCASVVQVLPDLLSAESIGGGSVAAYSAWVAVMIFSNLPSAASNVYKERELKLLKELDVWYVSFVVGAFQVVFGAATLPLVGLPVLPHYVPLDSLPNFIFDGFCCFLGQAPRFATVADSSSCASDPITAAGAASVYLTFNVTYAALMLLIFRLGSSALINVASSSSLALISLLLLVPFLAGPATAAPSAVTGVAATLAVTGAVMYHWWPEHPTGHDVIAPLPPVGVYLDDGSPPDTGDAPAFAHPEGSECGESKPLLRVL